MAKIVLSGGHYGGEEVDTSKAVKGIIERKGPRDADDAHPGDDVWLYEIRGTHAVFIGLKKK